MTIHVGWVRGISEPLIKVPEFVNVLNIIRGAVDECDNNGGILVEVRCRSGRHRSVCNSFCSYHQMRRRGHSATLVHYESPGWTSMKCGRTCSACRDHQNQRCLEKIGSILPPQHSGPILAPALPKAMPARPGRDVRDGADDTARDDSGRAIPIVADDEAVSVVDGQPFAARHLADMEKTMYVLYDRLEDLREEVADQKASQSSSQRSKSRRRSRSPLTRRSRRLPTPPPRPPSVPRRRRRHGSRSSPIQGDETLGVQ